MTHDSTLNDWQRLGPVILVGHRGAGKSTLGRRVAADLGRPFFDLDDEIARRAGRCVAELVEEDLDEFRRLERRVLRQLCDREPAPIIAPGAGLESFPDCATVIWLDRQDWRREVRESNRPRVRPDLDETAEWEWMESTREPRWRDAAHLRVSIPRGRTVDISADQLATLLTWLASTADNPLSAKTWLVPTEPADLRRAAADAQRFGFAGVEIRSDIFDEFPADDDIAATAIASLRHDGADWLNHAVDAPIWDIDEQFAAAVADNPPGSRPDRLIVSAHPRTIDPADIARLEEAAEMLSNALDLPADRIVLKYVAFPGDFNDLSNFLELADRLRASSHLTTVLAGNRRFAWVRPILAGDNATNYLPAGLRERTPDHPSPLDLGELLPHLAGPAPRQFDGLVGDPVDASQGDLWHRRASLEDDDGRFGYLKIPVARGELDDALPVLEQLPIRGLSVTSPGKTEAADSPLVDNVNDLPALNTLRRTPNADRPWAGVDTDTAGMKRSLKILESALPSPEAPAPGEVEAAGENSPPSSSPGGEVAEAEGEVDGGKRAVIFGRGGASHAVTRGLQQRDWNIVAHLSARKGWQPEHRELTDVDLIVNAAGGGIQYDHNTPPCRAWLDLHYNDVAPPPEGAIHLQGDPFFDAQAEAQRQFWLSKLIPSPAAMPDENSPRKS